MTVTSKVFCLFILACASLLILASGKSNLKNVEKIQHAIEAIYEDRLVVKGLIFDLSRLIHQKELALISGDQAFYQKGNAAVNTEIAEHLRTFYATKLTMPEAQTLNRFSEDLKKLQAIEKDFGLAGGDAPTPTEKVSLSKQIQTLHNDLQTLAEIQLVEGKGKLIASEAALQSMDTFIHIEKYMIFFFALLGLMLVVFVPRRAA